MDDKILRRHVIDELDFEPSVDAANIGVAVDQGVVSLTGHVPNYVQKSLAEQAVMRVKGVRGIAEALEVGGDGTTPHSDDDIARRALTLIDLNVLIPAGKIQIKVEQGWLTLTGAVEWDYQRTAANNDLRKMRGVMGIRNNITVAPYASAADVERRIKAALERSAEIESKGVRVTVQDGRVKLEGRVNSWADRDTLERAAWSAPGVCMVEDDVQIGRLA
ncbi:BON domain-containing protein [Caulobacter sp. S45]|uniref:BON domain-containing protein n=1 Tax=Caulobacter sp. S45 TaxID=1641861 RepID=UPI00131D3C0D|nr:BON domain-containing protein [Caulobacter sp. S45]